MSTLLKISATRTLATLAVAAAGALAVTAQAAGPADMDHGGGPGMMGRHAMMMGGPGGHGGHGGPGMGMMGGRGMERMLDQVNATAEQRAQIKTILQAARNDMQSQQAARKALHEQERAVWTQPTVDARAVETLRQQKLALHDAASKRMTQARLDISRVLTPEQRKLIGERMAQRQALMQRHQAERAALEGRK